MNKYIVWTNERYGRASIVEADDYDSAVKYFVSELSQKTITEYPEVFIQKFCTEYEYKATTENKISFVKSYV